MSVMSRTNRAHRFLAVVAALALASAGLLVAAGSASADAPLLLTASPEGVVVSPDGTRIYVSDDGTTTGIANGRILVFDAHTHQQLASFPDQGLIGARHITIAGHHLIVGGEDVGGAPGALALSKDGKVLLVANTYGPVAGAGVNLVGFNAMTGAFIGMTTLGDVANEIELTPNGQYAFVVDSAFDEVSAVNIGAFPGETVVSTKVPVGQPDSIAFSPDGSRGYLAAADGTVRVLDTTVSPAQFMKSLAVGGALAGIAISQDGRTLYVADDSTSGGVILVDTASGQAKGKLATGPANGIALDAARGLGFVADYADNAVKTVNLASGSVIGTTPVGKGPHDMAVNDRFGELYVVNEAGDSVSVVAIPSRPAATSSGSTTSTPTAQPPTAQPSGAQSLEPASASAISPLILGLIGLVFVLLIVMIVLVVVMRRRRST